MSDKIELLVITPEELNWNFFFFSFLEKSVMLHYWDFDVGYLPKDEFLKRFNLHYLTIQKPTFVFVPIFSRVAIM